MNPEVKRIIDQLVESCRNQLQRDMSVLEFYNVPVITCEYCGAPWFIDSGKWCVNCNCVEPGSCKYPSCKCDPLILDDEL